MIGGGELFVAKVDEAAPAIAAALLIPLIVGVLLLSTPTACGALPARYRHSPPRTSGD